MPKNRKIDEYQKNLIKYFNEKVKDTSIKAIFCEFSCFEELKHTVDTVAATLYFSGERKKRLNSTKMLCVYEIYPDGDKLFEENYTDPQYPNYKHIVAGCKDVKLNKEDLAVMLEISQYVNQKKNLCKALKETTFSYIFEESLELKLKIENITKKPFKKLKL